MSSAKGPIPPAPTPQWHFELLHPGCVHQTLYTSKIVFLGISSLSSLGLLLLVGRLLRHRWRAHRRREERWAALQQQQQEQQLGQEGEGNRDGRGSSSNSSSSRRKQSSQGVLAAPGFWRRWCVSLVGGGGGGPGWGGSSSGGAGPTGRVTIGDLFERLVLTLCGWELAFYAIDFWYLLDCNAPAAIGITADPDTVLHLKTLSTYLIKEALAMLILWLHGTIAYTLHAYTVQKISPARLARTLRVWLQALLAFGYMCLHAILSLTVRDRLVGYYIGRMSYDALVIPISLVTISRWYWLVIKELTRPTPTAAGAAGASGEPTPRPSQQQRQPSESQPGSSAGPTDLEAGTTPRTASVNAAAANNGVSPLNRRLALRLLLILGTTVTIWALLFVVDVSAWAHHHRGNRDVGLLVMVTLRSALARCVGLCDAVILGVDAQFFTFFAACCAPGWCGLLCGRRRQGRASGGRGTYSGEDADEEWCGEGDEKGPRGSSRDTGARTPSGSQGGAEPASFLARPVMLRHRSNSANSLRSFSLPRSGASARQLLGLGGSSTSLFSLAGGGALSFSQAQAQARQGAATMPEEEANAAVRAAEALRRARAPPLRPRQLRVFVATWNMGGVELDAPAVAPTPGGSSGGGRSGSTTERCADVMARLLPRWLPKGQDLYVLGVQECACLPRLRELLKGYLNQESEAGPTYAMFKTEIGDDTLMHGFIALTIFVRAEDVASGAFRLHRAGVGGVATGVGLGPMGRAANKGTTGLSCRYHDATLAFLTSHFCSDKKGKNRLERRNRDAATALRELALVWDAGPDVDVQCLHRFSFLLGDLNYRNLASPAAVLRRVARSARRMQAAVEAKAAAGLEGSTNWRAAAYARVLQAAAAADEQPQLLQEQEEGPAAADADAEEVGGPYLPYAPPAPALVRVLLGRRRGSSALGGGLPRPTPMSRLGSLWRRSSVVGGDGGGGGSYTGVGGGGGGGGGGLRRLLGVGPHIGGGGSEALARSRSAHGPASAPVMGGGRPFLSTIAGSSGTGSSRGGSHVSAGAGTAAAGAGGGGGDLLPTPLPLRPTPAHSALSSSCVSDGDASTSAGGHGSGGAFFFPAPPAVGPAIPSPLPLPSARTDDYGPFGLLSSAGGGGGGGGSHVGGDYIDDADTFSSDDDEGEENGNGGNGGSNAWAWVARVDELTLSRRGRLALWGFREKAIAFPPSYRFHRARTGTGSGANSGGGGDAGGEAGAGAGAAAAGEGLAGDFTSIERLARDAYTIHASVVAAGPAGGPGRVRRSSTAISSASSSGQPLPTGDGNGNANGNGNGNGDSDDAAAEDGRNEEEGGGSGNAPPAMPPLTASPSAAAAAAAACRHITRVPSYTDRVLAHAQPGYGGALHWLGYEMADCVELSDHRPVVGLFCLEVDAAVRGFEVVAMEGEQGEVAGEDTVVFTLTLRAPAVEWWAPAPLGGVGGDGGEGVVAAAGVGSQQQPHEAVIMFPLVSEDPLADARLASALGEALHGGLGGGGGQASSGGKGHGAVEVTCSSQRHVRWDAFPLRFQAVASKRFSEHLVIKLSDDRGLDMGQAVVPIVLGLPPLPPQASGSPSLPSVPRRLRFPLASAGVFKGWLSLELKVETSPLER